MTVGERIKKEREKFNISQTELAQKIGVSKQTLYKYETNIITNIPSDTIERTANVLNCSPAYLMGWDDKEPSKIIQYYNKLNDIGKHEAEKRVEELTYLPQYTTLSIKAAHNDYIDEPDELEKMRDDLSNLKRPDAGR